MKFGTGFLHEEMWKAVEFRENGISDSDTLFLPALSKFVD
jgi:hypothetical protein